jgi:hypothetical protein
MELFRPCRSGTVERHAGEARVIAPRGQVLTRNPTGPRCKRGFLSTSSGGTFVQGLYLLLAIVLLHDIVAPHPFASPPVLFESDQSIQYLDESHRTAAEFVEDDQDHSVFIQRGTLMPSLFLKITASTHSTFHQLLLISKDERPPKA